MYPRVDDARLPLECWHSALHVVWCARRGQTARTCAYCLRARPVHRVSVGLALFIALAPFVIPLLPRIKSAGALKSGSNDLSHI